MRNGCSGISLAAQIDSTPKSSTATSKDALVPRYGSAAQILLINRFSAFEQAALTWELHSLPLQSERQLDWPIQWCFLIDFIVVNQDTFTLREESSLIAAERILLQQQRNEKYNDPPFFEKIFPRKMLTFKKFLKFIPRYFVLKFEKLPHAFKTSWSSVNSNLF